MKKEIAVSFRSSSLKETFESLCAGRPDERRLHQTISLIIDSLRKDPLTGTKIQKNIWPRIYVKKYGITNLWKCDMPSGWRLIYTIESDDIHIVSIILEWFNHKKYEKRFKY